MKNKYLGFYAGFFVFAVPMIIGDLYRDYKQKKLKDIRRRLNINNA